MKSGYCCRRNSDVEISRRPWTNVARQTLSWIVPGVVLAAMPKCPLCLAAYVALFTGFGISLAVAKLAWWFVGVVCVAVLTYLSVTAIAHALRTRIGSGVAAASVTNEGNKAMKLAGSHRPTIGGNFAVSAGRRPNKIKAIPSSSQAPNQNPANV